MLLKIEVSIPASQMWIVAMIGQIGRAFGGAHDASLGLGACKRVRQTLLAIIVLVGMSPSGLSQTLTFDLAGTDVTLPRPPFFASPNLSGSANVTNSGAPATVFEGNGAFDTTPYSGVINGPVAVMHTDGLTIFAGTPGSGLAGAVANTYTGTTTIASGTLQLGDRQNIGTLGSGSVVNDGVLLLAQGINYGASGPVSLGNAISGSGSVLQQGPGTVLLAGANTYSGGTIVDGSGGTSQLLFASPAALSGAILIRNGGVAGTTYALDQAFLAAIDPSSVGAVALGTDSTNALDFDTPSLTSVRLGAASGACDANAYCTTNTYSGTLTPFGSAAGTPAYNLGGGNAILNVATSLADVPASGGGASTTSLVHDGDGYTILSGANSYTGGTTINAGVLQFATPAALSGFGTASVAIRPFAAAAAGFALDQTFLNSIVGGSQGTAALAVDSANALDLGNLPSISLGAAPGTSPTYSGTLTPNGSTYLLGGGRAGNAFANLNVASILTDGLTPRGLTVNSSGFTQAIDVHLLAVNTFTGPTLVDGGSLWLGNGTTFGNIPATAGVTLNNFSSLNFNEPTSLAFDRAIAGTGSVAQYGPGTVTLTGPVAYTGATFVFNGRLAVGPGSSLASSSVVRLLNFNNNPQPPVFDIAAGGNQSIQGLVGDATSTVVLGANRLSIGSSGNSYGTDPFDPSATPVFAGSITGSGGVSFLGNGAFVLSGASSYGGQTIVGPGTILSGGATNALSPSSQVVVNGVLNLGGFGHTIGSLSGAGLVTNGGTSAAALTTGGDGASTTFGGALSDGAGTLALVKTGGGTFTITGANPYSGGTTLKQGTLSIGGPNAIGSGILAMSEGTTFAFLSTGYTLPNAIRFTGLDDPTFDSGPGTVGISGPISGAAPLQKTGTGTLVLSGQNTYTGNTLVSAGTLQVDGSIASSPLTTIATNATLSGIGTVGGILAARGGVVAPGNPQNPYGTLTASGPVGFASGSALAVNSLPNAAGRLVTPSTATVAPGGALVVSPGPLTYATPVRLPILAAAEGLTGQFTSVAYTSTAIGLQPRVVYDGTTAYLEFGEMAGDLGGGPPGPDVLNSIASTQQLARERFGQFVTLRMLSSVLMGFHQQVSCGDCFSSFASGGSFSLGAQGRYAISDNLSNVGGLAYANYESGRVSVTSAPILAGLVRYDAVQLGSSRPFVDVGGVVAPNQNVHYDRRYGFGNTVGGGSGSSDTTSFSLFGRLGYVARLTPTDEVAAAVELARGWQSVGGYSESAFPVNPYPILSSGGRDTLNIAKVGGQWTHLFGTAIETQVNLGFAQAFDTVSGLNATVNGNAVATPIGNYNWVEYGLRAGYRLGNGWILDAFANGTLGARPIGDTIHGGMGARYSF